MIDLSAHSERSRLEKASGIDYACQIICQPSNDSLKHVSMKIHQYTWLEVDVAYQNVCHPTGS